MSINPRITQIANEGVMAAGGDGFVLFKWTCQGCFERVTFDQPNTVYTRAKHSEKLDGSPCGHVTDLNRYVVEADLGYALVMPEVPIAEVESKLAAAFERRDQSRRAN